MATDAVSWGQVIQHTYGLSSVSSPTVIASHAELKPSLPFRLRARVRGIRPPSE